MAVSAVVEPRAIQSCVGSRTQPLADVGDLKLLTCVAERCLAFWMDNAWTKG